MKIHGKHAETLIARAIATIPRPLTYHDVEVEVIGEDGQSFKTTRRESANNDLKIEVHAVPLGWMRQLDLVLPKVRPPSIPTGKMTNSGPEMKVDWEDKPFTQAVTERSDLSTYFMLHLCLKGSPGIEFETQEIVTADDLRKFRAEVTASGLSDGDVSIVLEVIRRLSNLSAEEVAARKAGF